MVGTRNFIGFTAYTTAVYATIIADAERPVITPGPVIVPRQEESQRFVGYYSTPGVGTWDYGRCMEGMSWSTSASYGECCSTDVGCGHNDFATACSGGVSVMYPDGPYSCLYACNTDYIYASTGDLSPTLWIGCDYGDQTTFYRTPPATAVTDDSITITGDPNFGFGSAPTVVTFPPTTTDPSDNPSDPFSTPVTNKKINLVPIIVGAVVGVIVLLGAIAFIVFVILNNKKKKKARELAAAISMPIPVYQPTQMQQQGEYLSSQPQNQQYPPPHNTQQNYYPPSQTTSVDSKTQNIYLQPQLQSQPPQPTPTPPPQWTPVSPITRQASVAPSDSASQTASNEQYTRETKGGMGTLSESNVTVSELGGGTQYTGGHAVSELSMPTRNYQQQYPVPGQDMRYQDMSELSTPPAFGFQQEPVTSQQQQQEPAQEMSYHGMSELQ